MEILALAWLADFVKTALGGAVSDRLKPAPSEERARELAFELYESLGALRYFSRSFVEALRIASLDASRTGELSNRIREVFEALQDVVDALRRINPQLEVHMPEVAAEIQGAYRTRSIVVTEVQQELHRLDSGEEVDLTPLVPQAEAALAEVEEATESLRSFLAREFTFKESF